MSFILKLLITFFIMFLLYWGAIELLWEEDKISDEWHDIVQEAGLMGMAVLMIGGIALIGIMLILFVWKGV